MATYVNDLRLKEIATGDESGTWGASTNTNLELIAEAFSFGTEAITTNADTHTTTIADGSTDPGRSLFLKYTGTLDSACTITIGPNTVSKLWLIQNSTSGGFSIIIKQGSGATVTVPNGQTKAIYSDGAGSGGAMVDAFAHLNVVDLTVEDDLTITDDLTVSGAFTLTGNADLNGDLDVDGTTNLDVVDIDGAVDFASTTAHAGNATFADNAKAIFGAGSDLQIYHDGSNSWVSDQGTGQLILESGGAGVYIQKGATETMANFVADGSVSLYYDNGKKFETTASGIDVTGSVTADGLTVSGDAVFTPDNDGVRITGANYATLRLEENDTTDVNTTMFNSSGDFVITTSNDARSTTVDRFRLDHATGDIGFYNAAGSSQGLFWDASAESLGIGTSSAGTFRTKIKHSAASVTTGLGIEASANDSVLRVFHSGSLAGFNATYSSTGAYVPMVFNVGSGGEAMRIDTSGNVGIGTSSPQAKLHSYTSGTGAIPTGQFNQTSDDNTALTLINANNSATYSAIKLETRETQAAGWMIANEFQSAFNGDLVFRGRDGGTSSAEVLRLKSNGIALFGKTAVDNTTQGIQIDGPSGFMSVARDAGIALLLDRSNSGEIQRFTENGSTVGSISVNSSRFTIEGPDNPVRIATGTSNIQINHDTHISFDTAGSEAMRISGGDVGIGTSSPDQTLHVHKGSAGTVASQANSVLTLENSTTAVLQFLTPNTAAAQIRFGDPQDNGAGFMQYDHSSSAMQFGVNGPERLRIDSSGNVLVGTTDTTLFNNTSGGGIALMGSNRLDVARAGDVVSTFNRMTDDGSIIQFYAQGALEGSIDVSGNTVSLVGFSGAHASSGVDVTTAKGTVVSTIDQEHKNNHAKIKISDSEGDARVYGVIDRISEEGDIIVSGVGIGEVKVTGACAGGDLLESNGDGTAKVQSDDIIRSKTLGKVTIGNSDEGVKLVSCVLYCG